jgi:dynein heavy chain
MFTTSQVANAFRHITIDKLNEFWNSDAVYRVIFDFLENPEFQAVYIKEGKGALEIYDTPHMIGKVQIFYIVKLNKKQVSEAKIMQELVYGDISANPFEHMASFAQRVFQPIVDSKGTVQTWSETISKDVRDCFETFVANVQITQGHVKGFTCLPLPSDNKSVKDLQKNSIGGEEINSDVFQNIHALEGALIVWTKQIKNVLKQDPESLFQTFINPNPMHEVGFWKAKAKNLNSIFDQLQSLKVRRVLKVLDKSKSTYNAPFAKLCKEVFHARAEANNIIKHLRPLESWFDVLESESDFNNLVNHFTPIIHMILLVWKSSAYYNTASRLVIMMREICNTLIGQATRYLNGDAIFELIEAGETQTAVKMLQTVLRIFGKFKSIYFEYKIKAGVDCPDNPWSVQNNAVFIRLDTFLERCHDILDFSQTILMFSKLAKIEIGGTKGKILTTSISQVYLDFNQAVEGIRLVGKGILDLENKQFEEAFYDFRNRIKELDRRLGSVIVQGFEDASTVAGRFRLLDSFDNLITRSIIADFLEKKHASLIESIRVDFELVQQLFNEMKDKPYIANNLPPIAGALSWCKSLRDRIQGPIEKLKTLDKKILEREDTKEVIKTFTLLIGQLADLDKENIEHWGKGIEDSSQAKLKNPLLRREVTENSSLLFVNFDPVLVRLLREVKYFLLLGLEVPPTAMEIFQRVEVFRRQTGNLDLIVNMYNDIQTTLLPVERPLVKAQLDRIDKTLSQGVGEGKNKAKALNWKSNGIDIFIGETMSEVKEVSEMLQMLKGNLKAVEQAVSVWQTAPIFERSFKTATVIDIINLQKKTRQSKLQAVKEAGQVVIFC